MFLSASLPWSICVCELSLCRSYFITNPYIWPALKQLHGLLCYEAFFMSSSSKTAAKLLSGLEYVVIFLFDRSVFRVPLEGTRSVISIHNSLRSLGGRCNMWREDCVLEEDAKKLTCVPYKTIVVQKIFPVNPYFYNFLVLSLINLSTSADFIVYIPWKSLWDDGIWL